MTPEEIRNEWDQDAPRSSFPQYHVQSGADRDAELVAFDQISRAAHSGATETANRGSRALPDATGAGEALVQQIAEAIDNLTHAHTRLDADWLDEVSRAVLPLVEAQVAPLRDAQGQMWLMWSDERRRADAAESALRQIRELADRWHASLPERRTGAAVHQKAIDWRDLMAVLDSAQVGAADTQPEKPLPTSIHGGAWRTRPSSADTQPEGAGAWYVTKPLHGWTCDCDDESGHEEQREWIPATPTAGSNGDTAPEAPPHRATAANCVEGNACGAPISSGLVCKACPPLGDNDPAWLHRPADTAPESGEGR